MLRGMKLSGWRAEGIREAAEAATRSMGQALREAASVAQLDEALGALYAEAMPLQLARLVALDEEARREGAQALRSVEEAARSAMGSARVAGILRRDASGSREAQLYLRDAQREGGLGVERREELQRLQASIEEMQTQGLAAIGADATRVLLEDAQLPGVDLEHYPLDPASGKRVVSMKAPQYRRVMRDCTNEETRRAVWHAYGTRAADELQDVLPRLVAARLEAAQLRGFASCAAYEAQTKMAGSEEAINAFLSSMSVALQPKLRSELEALRALKGSEVRPWDVLFYTHAFKKAHFDIDMAALRDYFEVDHTLRGIFALYTELLSVTFEEIHDAELWHPDVRAFSLSDERGQELGVFLLDMYPREGKYSHAACFWLRKGYSGTVKPAVAVVANLSRERLEHSEVVTLAHELGHAVHALCCQNESQRLNWTWTAVEGDFLEVPSMGFEKWLEGGILARISRHYQTGEPLPEDIVRKLNASKNAFEGYAWSNLVAYARFDMALHSANIPKDLNALYAALQKEVLNLDIGEPAPRWASWTHMYSGVYQAAYYSYLWSEIIACSIYAHFGDNPLDPELGLKLRRAILEPGCAKTGEQMTKDFLGEHWDPSDASAFLANLKVD